MGRAQAETLSGAVVLLNACVRYARGDSTGLRQLRELPGPHEVVVPMLASQLRAALSGEPDRQSLVNMSFGIGTPAVPRQSAIGSEHLGSCHACLDVPENIGRFGPSVSWVHQIVNVTI